MSGLSEVKMLLSRKRTRYPSSDWQAGYRPPAAKGPDSILFSQRLRRFLAQCGSSISGS